MRVYHGCACSRGGDQSVLDILDTNKGHRPAHFITALLLAIFQILSMSDVVSFWKDLKEAWL